jgi:hypothetical protein
METLSLREYVIFTGASATVSVFEIGRWISFAASAEKAPLPFLSKLGSPLTNAYVRAVDEHFQGWSRTLQPSHSFWGATAPLRRSAVIDDNAREQCRAALSSLFGAALLSGLIELDSLAGGPDEALCESAQKLAATDLLGLLGKPHNRAWVDALAVHDPLTLRTLFSSLAPLMPLLSGLHRYRAVGTSRGRLRLGAALAAPMVAMLRRPGWLGQMGQDEQVFSVAHDALAFATVAGERPDLLESTLRPLFACARWSEQQQDLELAAYCVQRVAGFIDDLFPPCVRGLAHAVATSAEAHAVQWAHANYDLLAPPTHWKPPADHTATTSQWALLAPEIVALLPADPHAASEALARTFLHNPTAPDGARTSAALAVGQLAAPSAEDALRGARDSDPTSPLGVAAERGLDAIFAAPAPQWPELSRRIVLDAARS